MKIRVKFLQKIMSEMGIGHHKNNRTYESFQRSKGHHGKSLFNQPSFDTDSSPSQKCSNCQNINNIEAKFCKECGGVLNIVKF